MLAEVETIPCSSGAKIWSIDGTVIKFLSHIYMCRVHVIVLILTPERLQRRTISKLPN
jgi:hypothetical protein